MTVTRKVLRRAFALTSALGLVTLSVPAQALTPITLNITINSFSGTCTQFNGLSLPTACPLPGPTSFSRQFDFNPAGVYSLTNVLGGVGGDILGIGTATTTFAGTLTQLAATPNLYAGTNFTLTGRTGSAGCTTCREYSLTAATFSATGPVPEPATWAMMISGLALVGAAMRKRMSVRYAFAQ
jgi:hypothetical protein